MGLVVVMSFPLSNPEVEAFGREPTAAGARRRVDTVVAVARGRLCGPRLGRATAVFAARVHFGVRDGESALPQLVLEFAQARQQQVAQVGAVGADRQPQRVALL